MTDQNYNDQHNVSKQGEKYKATVTKLFDSMDEATNWTDSTATKETPEKAASEMSVSDAEEINSNVNPAPIPNGADQQLSGGGSTDAQDSTKDETQTHAPHEMGDPKANDANVEGQQKQAKETAGKSR